MGNYRDLNDTQMCVMVFIKKWANEKKTPIPRKQIMLAMMNQGFHERTVRFSIDSLLHKEYIRYAYSEKGNVSLYVMIRNI